MALRSRCQNLNHLPKLKILSVQANRLTRITGLEALPQLQELYVSENGISELSGLEAQVSRK